MPSLLRRRGCVPGGMLRGVCDLPGASSPQKNGFSVRPVALSPRQEVSHPPSSSAPAPDPAAALGVAPPPWRQLCPPGATPV